MQEIDVLSLLRRAHLPSQDDSAESLLGEVAILERHIRLAVCLTAAVGRAFDVPPKLPRRGGFGEYLRLGIYLAASIGAHDPSVPKLWRQIEEAVTMRHEGLDDGSAYTFRNYLMHGGVVPSGSSSRVAIGAVRREVEQALERWIDTRSGINASGGRIHFGDGTALYPLVIETEEGVATYHDASDQVMCLSTTNRAKPRLWVRKERALFDQVAKLLEDPAPLETRVAARDFVAALRQDINAFSEAGRAAVVTQASLPIRVDWYRRTSKGTELRSDSFRITKGGSWQWRHEDLWVPYEEFLRAIANWEVVVERLLRRHDGVAAFERKVARSARLSNELIMPPQVLPRFRATEAMRIGDRAHRPDDAVAFDEVLDESAEATIGKPEVFFVAGEAGVGKTHNLVKAAVERSKRLSNLLATDGALAERVPLYLYVSCSGVGLKSLKDLINAAVVETQNLTYESVLSLCRNGMLVLVIDGFDELVGGAGYRDAFQLLEPTLRLLGSRGGTVVLSARSSYLANQYKHSLARSSVEAKTPVEHYMLELLRWNPRDVEALFASNPSWEASRQWLSAEDLTLLGVPFFARVFNEYCLSGATPSDSLHLRDLLIDAYVEREVGKLSTGGGNLGGIDQTSVRTLMRELAGMMFDSGVYVLSQEDFEFACVAALELEDPRKSRALLDRLTVLCGMAVELDDADDAIMFSFEHEVIFETLLADYLSSYLFQGSNTPQMHDVLARGLLGQSTVSGLVDRRGQELEAFLRTVSVHSSSPGDEYRSNVSALVTAVAEARGTLNYDCAGLEVEALNLTHVTGAKSLSKCLLKKVVLRTENSASFSLDSCRVLSLEVHLNEVANLSLRLQGLSEISELILFKSGVVAQLVSGHRRVIATLQELGIVETSGSSLTDEEEWSDLQLFAHDSLAPIRGQYGASYVVHARTRIPGDDGSRWCRRPRDPRWAQLTDALVQSGIGQEKRINASGSAKSSITIRADIDSLLDDRLAPEHAVFWSILR